MISSWFSAGLAVASPLSFKAGVCYDVLWYVAIPLLVCSRGRDKSLLLQHFGDAGILGEIHRSSGHLAVRGGVAYCAQQPWIRNVSLMDNILFGEELDDEWYNKVLDACALGPDLKQLPHGDQTEIGERGVTISGGQKQRVALARAVYQRACSMVILDDVFSALDAHTSSHIVRALFQGPQALLRDRAVLLASHLTACAGEAQRVLLLGMAAHWIRGIHTRGRFNSILRGETRTKPMCRRVWACFHFLSSDPEFCGLIVLYTWLWDILGSLSVL